MKMHNKMKCRRVERLQKKGSKGYVYTLEVMLAVSLIFVTLILDTTRSSTST